MKGLHKNLSDISLAFLLLTSLTSFQSEANDFSPLSKFRAFKSRLANKINSSSTTVSSSEKPDNYNRQQSFNKVIIEPEMSDLRKPAQIEAQIDQMILAKWKKPDSVDQYNWEKILMGVKQASKKTGIPQQLIMSLINKESAFNFNAQSRTGAIGLMQLMPSTALNECKISNSNDLYDIELNIKCGTDYLDKQIKYFKRVDLALAAYNAGPGAVRRAVDKAKTDNIDIVTSLLKPETAPYVQKILANINYGDDFL